MLKDIRHNSLNGSWLDQVFQVSFKAQSGPEKRVLFKGRLPIPGDCVLRASLGPGPRC